MKILKEADVNGLELSEIKSLDDFNEWLLRAVKNDKRIRKIVNNVYNSVNSVNLTSDDKKFIEEIVLKNFKVKEKDKIFKDIVQKMTPEDIKGIKNYNKTPINLTDGTIKSGLSSGLVETALGKEISGVGKGEVLLALLGGTKQTTAGKGDIELNGQLYEVKYVEQAAPFNEKGVDFNTAVNNLFTKLSEYTEYKGVNYKKGENYKRMRRQYFEDITNEQVKKAAVGLGLDNIINDKNGADAFEALAIESAKRACGGGNVKFLLLTNDGGILKYKIVKYNEIFEIDKITIVFDTKHGGDTDKCFKFDGRNW